LDFQNLTTYIELGFRHILPDGLDHILFIVAVFLSARSAVRLLVQVSAFTLSHTLTLGLTAAGVLKIDPHIVEPLIALSIAIVGVSAFFRSAQGQGLLGEAWRLPAIFAFGLFHGMGFGHAMHDMFIGADFPTVLLGAYLGVELGQLTVLAAAFAATFAIRHLLKAANREAMYRRVVVQPAAIAVAVVGSWWFLERLGVFGPVA
jgi:hypothetical protein